MSQALQNNDARAHYAEALKASAEDSAAPAWLRERRAIAAERFSVLGFPTKKLENWRYTSLAPIARKTFELTAPATAAESIVNLSARTFGATHWSALLVFVDGRYAPALSKLEGLPSGVTVKSLAESWDHPSLEAHYGRIASFEDQGMTALNTGLASEGVFVHLAKGASVERPIQALFLTGLDASERAVFPRVFVHAEESSSVCLVENFDGPDGQLYLTNAVSEFRLEPNAQVEHYRLNRESEDAYHVGVVQADQARDSRFVNYSISTGAALMRADIGMRQLDPSIHCEMHGLYVARGNQHVDHHTVVDHAMPHGSSNESYKGIIVDKASGVFNGKVIVREDAQKTDSKQSNKNLLLSEDALINTKPELEIYADDVRCAHGATIGQLDEDQLFYLRSRGIGGAAARDLLTFAFASDVIEGVKIEELKQRLSNFLAQRFSKVALEDKA